MLKIKPVCKIDFCGDSNWCIKDPQSQSRSILLYILVGECSRIVFTNFVKLDPALSQSMQASAFCCCSARAQTVACAKCSEFLLRLSESAKS